eukprot:GHVP01044612.1.p1 GENE.GHVP01044612.1~~GHVP01044612.1.p1  ORF type:complete len:1039 (-),score=194.76 GHVP01044612.1:2000-4687(-)
MYGVPPSAGHFPRGIPYMPVAYYRRGGIPAGAPSGPKMPSSVPAFGLPHMHMGIGDSGSDHSNSANHSFPYLGKVVALVNRLLSGDGGEMGAANAVAFDSRRLECLKGLNSMLKAVHDVAAANPNPLRKKTFSTAIASQTRLPAHHQLQQMGQSTNTTLPLSTKEAEMVLSSVSVVGLIMKTLCNHNKSRYTQENKLKETQNSIIMQHTFTFLLLDIMLSLNLTILPTPKCLINVCTETLLNNSDVNGLLALSIICNIISNSKSSFGMHIPLFKLLHLSLAEVSNILFDYLHGQSSNNDAVKSDDSNFTPNCTTNKNNDDINNNQEFKTVFSRISSHNKIHISPEDALFTTIEYQNTIDASFAAEFFENVESYTMSTANYTPQSIPPSHSLARTSLRVLIEYPNMLALLLSLEDQTIIQYFRTTTLPILFRFLDLANNVFEASNSSNFVAHDGSSYLHIFCVRCYALIAQFLCRGNQIQKHSAVRTILKNFDSSCNKSESTNDFLRLWLFLSSHFRKVSSSELDFTPPNPNIPRTKSLLNTILNPLLKWTIEMKEDEVKESLCLLKVSILSSTRWFSPPVILTFLLRQEIEFLTEQVILSTYRAKDPEKLDVLILAVSSLCFHTSNSDTNSVTPELLLRVLTAIDKIPSFPEYLSKTFQKLSIFNVIQKPFATLFLDSNFNVSPSIFLSELPSDFVINKEPRAGPPQINDYILFKLPRTFSRFIPMSDESFPPEPNSYFAADDISNLVKLAAQGSDQEEKTTYLGELNTLSNGASIIELENWAFLSDIISSFKLNPDWIKYSETEFPTLLSILTSWASIFRTQFESSTSLEEKEAAVSGIALLTKLLEISFLEDTSLNEATKKILFDFCSEEAQIVAASEVILIYRNLLHSQCRL